MIVAIDPPAGLNGSACGIVVAGCVREEARADRAALAGARGQDWVAYVLVRKFGAVTIVAEANQGARWCARHLLLQACRARSN